MNKQNRKNWVFLRVNRLGKLPFGGIHRKKVRALFLLVSVAPAIAAEASRSVRRRPEDCRGRLNAGRASAFRANANIAEQALVVGLVGDLCHSAISLLIAFDRRPRVRDAAS